MNQKFDPNQIRESLANIFYLLRQADNIFEKDRALGKPGQWDVPEMQAEYCIESAFLHTLVLLDRLELSRTYHQVEELHERATKDIFATSVGVDEPYLRWSSDLYIFLNAIGGAFNAGPASQVVQKDLLSILRSTLYSITDRKIFEKPPANEPQVHYRIEAVLKTVFPDLLHKPSINKPIKNFEPDTGLPSVDTLIEYKFISDLNDAKRVSDEVLADTRGYYSRDWKSFVYVIYETRRIKPEAEWKQLLTNCGVSSNTEIIVLLGE